MGREGEGGDFGPGGRVRMERGGTCGECKLSKVCDCSGVRGREGGREGWLRSLEWRRREMEGGGKRTRWDFELTSHSCLCPTPPSPPPSLPPSFLQVKCDRARPVCSRCETHSPFPPSLPPSLLPLGEM
jgi:hypothetical protein